MSNINVYFGEVVDVADEEKLNRIKVSIPGKTDKLETNFLSWYYPFLGMDQIPVTGDKISVLIFNGNFTTGFYLKKIPDSGNAQVDFDGSEYENYLEIFKRDAVQLTYNEEDGIQFINDKSKIQALPKEINLDVDGFIMKLVKDRLDIGFGGPVEATPLGDKTVKVLLDDVKLETMMYENCLKIFQAISAGCGNNPFLVGIKIGIESLLPTAKSSVKTPTTKLNADINKIQSKKTFIE